MPSAQDDPFRAFGSATPEEIQRAHDLVHAIISGEAGLPISGTTQGALMVIHDVLSWVLGFECGDKVKAILNVSLQCLREKGVTVWQSPPQA